ncbi:MAG: hypothetical protein OXL40_09155 [Bacteroidota bacterium]|nr:hypothetical protein [Bacteroidota bacterium]
MAPQLFWRTILNADLANQPIEIIEGLISIEAANSIARLESKIDARFDALDTKLDANAKLQNTKYNLLIGILSAILIMAIAGRFVG